MRYSKLVRIALGAAALALLMTGSGHAFVNHENQLTFSRSVALPGVVLPAGAYSFDLVDSKASMDVVIVQPRARRCSTWGLRISFWRPKGMSKDTPVTFAAAQIGTAHRSVCESVTQSYQFLYRSSIA